EEEVQDPDRREDRQAVVAALAYVQQERHGEEQGSGGEVRGGPGVEHAPREEVHGRHREQTEQREGKPRGERAHAEELEGGGGDVDGEPGGLPPDVVLVGVLAAARRDESRAW